MSNTNAAWEHNAPEIPTREVNISLTHPGMGCCFLEPTYRRVFYPQYLCCRILQVPELHRQHKVSATPRDTLLALSSVCQLLDHLPQHTETHEQYTVVDKSQEKAYSVMG